MSTFVIAFLVAIAGGTWSFSKIQHRTGGNTQTSLTMGAIAAVILFILTYIVMGFVPE